MHAKLSGVCSEWHVMSEVFVLVLLRGCGRLHLEVNYDANGNKSEYMGKILQPLAQGSEMKSRTIGVVSLLCLVCPLPILHGSELT